MFNVHVRYASFITAPGHVRGKGLDGGWTIYSANFAVAQTPNELSITPEYRTSISNPDPPHPHYPKCPFLRKDESTVYNTRPAVGGALGTDHPAALWPLPFTRTHCTRPIPNLPSSDRRFTAGTLFWVASAQELSVPCTRLSILGCLTLSMDIFVVL